MTTGSNSSNDLREREWRLQEQARLDQKLGVAAEGSARALRYRRLARELEQPLDAALPSNFPHAQVMRIEAIAAERRRVDKRFERRLRWGFVGGYGVFICGNKPFISYGKSLCLHRFIHGGHNGGLRFQAHIKQAVKLHGKISND